MANDSEKKAQKQYERLSKLYTQIATAITVVYVLLRIWPFGAPFGWLNWAGFLLLSAVNFFGLKLIFSYLALGHPRSSYSYVEEVVWVNWFVQGTSALLSDWFWLFYLAVPAYALYKFNEKTFRSMFLNEREPEAAPPTAEEQRKAAKKEAKANRVRYMRA